MVQALIHTPEVGVDSLERLVVKLIRGAKANDPTNGGLNSVSKVTEAGIEESLTPVLRV